MTERTWKFSFKVWPDFLYQFVSPFHFKAVDLRINVLIARNTHSLNKFTESSSMLGYLDTGLLIIERIYNASLWLFKAVDISFETLVGEKSSWQCLSESRFLGHVLWRSHWPLLSSNSLEAEAFYLEETS